MAASLVLLLSFNQRRGNKIRSASGFFSSAPRRGATTKRTGSTSALDERLTGDIEFFPAPPVRQSVVNKFLRF